MTIILGIEMSNPNASPEFPAVVIARRADSGVLDFIARCTMPKSARGADAVMAMVSDACVQAGVVPNEINAIAVSIGPGGYTALRIATTSAKVLARTLGCALYGVETARVAASNIGDEHCPAMIALASKGTKAWCAIVRTNNGKRTIETLGVVEVDSLENARVRTIFADAHLPESFARRAAGLGIEIRPLVLDACACIEVAMGIDPIEPGELTPLYPREPDAVTQWRERHGEKRSRT